MHPADLSQHRESRARATIRDLERDVARLLPRLTPTARVDLTALADAARAGHISPVDAHHLVRDQIAHLDRQHAA